MVAVDGNRGIGCAGHLPLSIDGHHGHAAGAVIGASGHRGVGDAELRFGVVAPGGWIIKQRTRTSWEYSPEVRELIRGIQTQAQQDGEAEAKSSTYLCQITSA